MSLLLASNSGGSTEKLYSSDVFSTFLYQGNGGSQTINNGIDLAQYGGLVWIKGRSSWNHLLYDTVRGATTRLSSNLTDAQVVNAGFGVTSFSSNGFTGAGANAFNESGHSYVSWTFRNAPNFFTHTVVSHSNGVATNISLNELGELGMVVAKITNTTGDWVTWHRSLTAGNNLWLNTTAAQTSTNAWLSVSGTTATIASTAPTGTYVIYAWAHDTALDGIIQCGSFTTDGSGNATVNLGWEPQYVILKKLNITGDWNIHDVMRSASLSSHAVLSANLSNAEVVGNIQSVAPTSTGFSVKNGTPNETHIYLTIRRPNKPPKTGAEVFEPKAVSYSQATPVSASFPADLLLSTARTLTSAGGFYWQDRLRGFSNDEHASNGTALFSSATTAEQTTVGTSIAKVWNDRFWQGTYYTGSSAIVQYLFRRAPGFFSSFAYTGTGANRTIPHDLAAVPDLLIVKSRSAPTDWQVWCNALAANEKLVLNSTAGKVTDATAWNNTLPTSTNISLSTASATNANNATFIAYAFSNLPGISKVGSYTGNGSSQTIDCGFSAGCRFFLVKATSTTGNWWVFDSVRGILTAADPALALNSTTAEITTADAVDNDPSGIIVNQEATCSINANGTSYIYLAIA